MVHAIYKPIQGERPLADFPTGTLALREEAAWQVSEVSGWSIVPPTLVRDGPAGRGMVQLWIETDDDTDILRMILTRDDRLRRMSVFDALVNNADRKGGPRAGDRSWGPRLRPWHLLLGRAQAADRALGLARGPAHR